MSLTLPTVSSTIGPDWASEINTALTTVDLHNHTSGLGLQVPVAGLNINADLSLAGYNLTTSRSLRMSSQVSPIAIAADLGCLYVSGADLWYNNTSGVQIQLTAAGALNAASIGGIGGDYATSTASVFFTDSTDTYTFWQNTNQSGKVDVGPILLRKTSASSAAITITPDAALSSGYTLTLPAAVPGSTTFVSCDTSGNLAFSNSLVTLALSGALTVGSTLTVTGAATFNGAVTLGDATGDTVTVTGRFASDLIPSTTSTRSLGSASLSFAGLYLNNGATDNGAIYYSGGTTLFEKAIFTAGFDVLTIGGFAGLTPSSSGGASLGSIALPWATLTLATSIGTSTPVANRLYADLIPKAWSTTASTGTVNASVNLTCSRTSTGTYQYSFRTNLSSASFALMITPVITGGASSYGVGHSNRTTSGFVVTIRDSAGTVADATHCVSVFGTQ